MRRATKSGMKTIITLGTSWDSLSTSPTQQTKRTECCVLGTPTTPEPRYLILSTSPVLTTGDTSSTTTTGLILRILRGCSIPGRYGEDCSLLCPENCNCDVIDNTCVECFSGYKGHLCYEECDGHTYGLECNQSCGKCSGGVQCDHVTGSCPNGCDAGMYGDKCDLECDGHTYGLKCNQSCGNCSGGVQCDHVTGSCPNGCAAGMYGDKCDLACGSYTYGVECKEICGNCSNGEPCHHVDGTCPSGCDAGAYGVTCKESCGNCSNRDTCNDVDGSCPYGCDVGVYGKTCDEACQAGRYGNNCAKTCGQNCQGCNRFNGVCEFGCHPGWTGTFCEKRNVQSTSGINGVDISNLSQEYNVIRLAFALTVPGMFVLCLGVNFLCYKIGFKKGTQKSKFKDTQGVHYHHYDNENDPLRGAGGEGPGPSRGQIIIDPAAHDYAAYDEIKEQRQRMIGSQRGKDGGYITPMSKDRPLPAVGGDGNGYMSPTAAAKESSKSKDSPSPPGNGGYLSPLEEQLAKHSSSNSDSSSNKSDKSRKYQNDPRGKPKTQGLYESIKDAGVTQEHQYIDLQRNVVS